MLPCRGCLGMMKAHMYKNIKQRVKMETRMETSKNRRNENDNNIKMSKRTRTTVGKPLDDP